MTADLFHVGHLRAIRQAKKRCKHLTVGLLDVPEYKLTVIPYSQRREIIMALPEVDKVVKQNSLRMNLKYYDIVFSEGPWEPDEMLSISKQRIKIGKINYYHKQSTTKIKQKINEEVLYNNSPISYLRRVRDAIKKCY